MLVYYRLSGVNAVVALVFNLVILLGLMAYIGAVMTLPGIAGFVLTMGIGVDSNVLIFERIKEELEAQRGVRASINAGFGRVFWTLVDTHIAALISAAFLFQFGTGPIRGFAVTLFFGLMSNLFTSIFVSKTLFELVLVAAASRSRRCPSSHAYFQEHQLRLPPLALARDRAVVGHHHRGRRHVRRRRAFRTASSSPAAPSSSCSSISRCRCSRCAARSTSRSRAAARTPSCRRTAIRRSTR